MTNLDKLSSNMYSKFLDKVKQAALQATDQETKSSIQWFMNKPKLIALFKILDQKTDSLSIQNQVVEIFGIYDQAINRCLKISLPQQLVNNLHELGQNYLKSFKEKFLDKVVDSLEAELPAS